MNERIKELLVKAGAFMPGTLGLDAGHPAVGFQSKESFEMFVELLVKHCIGCIDNAGKIEWVEPPTYDLAIDAAKFKVQQYFGVKV